MAKPWLTSSELIATVKRKISFPTYQSTFSDDDVLAFANDEIRDSLLPNILKYHEEFFVTSTSMSLVENQSSYPIPNRAVGMKLRDIFYGDGNLQSGLPYGNLYEMTRINPDDKAWFETAGLANQTPYKFYVEGNNIVLVPGIISVPTGQLVFYWFMRPNQLVDEDRAFIISGFSKNVTITNSSIAAGNTLTINLAQNGATSTVQYVFTAVAGAPAAFQFQIAGTSSATASNLVSAINNANLGITASNGSPATNVIKLAYQGRNSSFSASNTAAMSIQATLGIDSANVIPSNITVGSYIDILQELPGHKTLNYDIIVPNGALSGSNIALAESLVPTTILVGDYIASRNECIIPQIPPELHSSLAERVSARILAAIGDKEGLAVSNQKIQDLDAKEGMLVDDRVNGAPQKILNRNSPLRFQGFRARRRW